MEFSYLHNMKELISDPMLFRFIEKYKNKLEKYKCIEIGSGNLLKSISIAPFFKQYDTIEISQTLYNIGKYNIERYKSSIGLKNISFSDFLDTNKTKYNITIFINSIHFIDTILLRYSTLYILVIHPRYDGDNFGDDKLNRNSDNFSLELWNKNKENLEKYEKFIRDNYIIIYEDSNKKQILFIGRRKTEIILY